MDRIAHLKSVISKVMEQYVREREGQEQDVFYKIIADEARNQYQVVLLGWLLLTLQTSTLYALPATPDFLIIG